MIEGLVTGTLMALAEERQGKNDCAFVVARLKAQPGEGEPLIVNVIAFTAEARAACAGPVGRPGTVGLPGGPQARA